MKTAKDFVAVTHVCTQLVLNNRKIVNLVT